jgi:hypothetical protein
MEIEDLAVEAGRSLQAAGEAAAKLRDRPDAIRRYECASRKVPRSKLCARGLGICYRRHNVNLTKLTFLR